MASITINNSSITATSNTVTINYTTDVTLSKVELTKDSSTWITARTFSQTSASFDISSWSNGTYSNCKLRITYETVTNYGQIVLNTSTISLNEGSEGSFTVKLDSAPTSNQVVNLSVNNSNCSLNKSSLTFTPSNYSTTQSVTITGAHDSSSYSNKTSTITASSNGVTSKTINVTIKNIDTQPSSPLLSISNVNAGTFTTSDNATITYTTSVEITKHEYRMQKSYAYTDGTAKVTSSGNNHTMTFNPEELSAGTKNGSIRVTDANGNTAEADFTMIINETTYTITKNLTNCSCSNSASSITFGSSYSATISANSGYNLSSITVTMGGTNITSSAVSGSNISISKVTGNIVITASATQQETPSQPNPPSSGSALNDWDVYNNTYSYNYVAYMASQVGVKNKAIRITADKKTVTAVPTGGTGQTTTKDYVSGGLVTKKAFKYGTFTFKCRLSANNTYLWAMIWTLPDSTSMARPEFDLWESWGSKTNNAIVQTYHAFDSAGNDKMNYQQANTPVDLTQEHEVKAVWTQDNVFKMYCDGVLKLTIKDYMVNWKTGEVDYQLWFLNLGLGTFDNQAPNGTGWMEITDYKFEPVYTRDRVKQHTYCGNWTDGTAPSGPLPSSSGSSSGGGSGGNTGGDSGGDTGTLTITDITVLSSTVASTQINYTTNKAVTTHYFNMWYNGSDSAFTDGTVKVIDNGNNNYTMTFANELSAGTKSPAIKVADAEGNTYIKTFDLTVTN